MKPWHKANERLKEMLIDFELAYRTFESAYWTQHHAKRMQLIPEARLLTVQEIEEE